MKRYEKSIANGPIINNGHHARLLVEVGYRLQVEEFYSDKEMEENVVEGKNLRKELVVKLLVSMTNLLISQVFDVKCQNND